MGSTPINTVLVQPTRGFNRFSTILPSSYWPYLLLILVWSLGAFSTWIWMQSNRQPFSWDSADHLRFALEYHQAWQQSVEQFNCRFLYHTQYYPPFYHLLLAGAFLILGSGISTALIVNLLLLLLLMLATYTLGQRLYGTTAGFTAAVLVASYHINAALLHEFFVDFPLMCWVGISLYLLYHRTDLGYSLNSVIVGVTLAIGVLCKQTYVFFLLLPMAYWILIASWQQRQQPVSLAKSVGNLFLIIIVATLVAGSWYFPHINDVREIYAINQAAAAWENEAPLLSYQSNLSYLHALASEQIQLPFFGLFLIGLLYSLYQYRLQSLPLYLTIIGGLVTFTLILNKDTRYTVPFLPAVALLSTCWLESLKWVMIRYLATAIILTAAAMSFYHAQWPTAGNGKIYQSTVFYWQIYGRNYLNFDRYPSNSNQLTDLLPLITNEAILHLDQFPNNKIKVGFIPNLYNLNPSALAVDMLLWNEAHPYYLLRPVWLTTTSDLVFLPRCHYIVARETLDSRPENTHELAFQQYLQQHHRNFKVIAKLPLTNHNTKLVVYRQIHVEENHDVQPLCLLGRTSR
jgi:4-amino-4-deoxy-L-arabinose transferase-like glycosyltransferase